MPVYERIRVLLDETFSVYDLATFGGTLFTVFAVFSLALLLSRRERDKLARNDLVIPSLFILIVAVNPVLLHFAIKIVSFYRLPRLLWAFPFELVIVYCITEWMEQHSQWWKKALVAAGILAVLFWGADARIPHTLTVATNAYKIPDYTIELSELIHENEDAPDPIVAAQERVSMWFRQYDANIRIPYTRLSPLDQEMRSVMEAETLDLDLLGEKYAREYDCDFIVLDSSRESRGSLMDYGYTAVGTVEDRFTVYKYAP